MGDRVKELLCRSLMFVAIATADTAFAQSVQSGASPLAAPPKPCSTIEYRQFDFWLGEWDVFAPNGKPAGQSRIEQISADCALLENWSSGGGAFTGKSLNIYDSNDKRWHQSWVDSSGSRLELTGGFVDKKMVLEGTALNQPGVGGKTTHRITWTVNADASVRQLWESSTDGGKTWSIAFDGKYVKSKGVAAGAGLIPFPIQ